MASTSASASTAKTKEADRRPNAADSAGPAELTAEQLAAWRSEFESRPGASLMQNAVTQNRVEDVALRRDVVTGTDHTFSHVLDDWSVTDQKRSGRCWMFAGLNLLRVGAMKQMNLDSFEFSQNYVQFGDKLERANYFLESIIETADRPADDRRVAWLLEHPLDDGGQWNMFVSLVRKHGLAPKSVMPETVSSSDTRRMNANLMTALRQGARDLRETAQQADDPASPGAIAAMRESKQETLRTVHRMLCIHLGTPPAEFDWQWNDKDKAFHRDGRLTPQRFASRYLTLPIEEYVCLVHDPRPEHPFGRTYTVEFLGNMVGAEPVKYLNVEIETMKRIAMRSIMDGEPVWMGCDVGQQMQRDMGLWDAKLYDYEGVYDTRFTLDKAQRLTYHETAMTHAMLFTGVDVVEDENGPRPRRWRVENSWGEEAGRKGFYCMNDSWFDEHMFEIAARKSHLPAELEEAAEQEPIVLPPWDPMGSLARG